MLHWFSLRRWENYCLLAIASVSWLLITTIRTHHTRSMQRLAADIGTGSMLASTAFASPYGLPKVTPMARNAEPLWRARHRRLVQAASRNDNDVILLGDSITQGWEAHQDLWQASMPGVRTLNAGIGSDRVEHVLWRVEHGLLRTARPRLIVLMAGINNLAVSSPDEIAGGLSQIIAAIHARSPDTQILLLGLLPSGEEATHPRRARIQRANAVISTLGDGLRVHYLDSGTHFLNDAGVYTRQVSFDGIHLTRAGYAIWARVLHRRVLELLGQS